MRLLIGTWASHFHEVEFDEGKATLKIVSSVEAPSPAWLCQTKTALYAVEELDGALGALVRFENVDGKWSRRWRSETSAIGPCHCSIATVSGKTFILVANYDDHTVDVFSDAGERIQSIEFEGSGPFQGRQETSHCHQVIQDLASRYIYVNDLGGDIQHRYTMAHDGTLQEVSQVRFTPGQGPRHSHFNARFPKLVYTICELSNEIVVHDWTSDQPTVIQTISILPDGSAKGEKHKEYPQPASAGEIWMTKDGRYLYATTRFIPEYRSDTILFAPIDEQGMIGRMNHLNTGLVAPWHISFNADETILAVAFRESCTIKMFARNKENGGLSELASLDTGLDRPCCILPI